MSISKCFFMKLPIFVVLTHEKLKRFELRSATSKRVRIELKTFLISFSVKRYTTFCNKICREKYKSIVFQLCSEISFKNKENQKNEIHFLIYCFQVGLIKQNHFHLSFTCLKLRNGAVKLIPPIRNSVFQNFFFTLIIFGRILLFL